MKRLRAAIVPIALSIPDSADIVGSSETVLKTIIGRGDLAKRYIEYKPVLLYEELLEWSRNLPFEPPTGGAA